MTEEIQVEISMLLCAFALGVLLGVVSNGLGLLRKFIFRGKICAVCMDILYWIGAAGAAYGLMYRYASGTLRGIILICVLAGLAFTTVIDRKLAKMFKKRVKNC